MRDKNLGPSGEGPPKFAVSAPQRCLRMKDIYEILRQKELDVSVVASKKKNLLIWNSTKLNQKGTTPGKRLPWREGWMSRKISAPLAQGEKCFLTSPFIEQALALIDRPS
jgi:hypothetical protein